MSPLWRRRLAGVGLAVSLVGWPLSQLTVARGEPPFVLGLSWLAIILTLVDVFSTQDVRKEQDDDGSG